MLAFLLVGRDLLGGYSILTAQPDQTAHHCCPAPVSSRRAVIPASESAVSLWNGTFIFLASSSEAARSICLQHVYSRASVPVPGTPSLPKHLPCVPLSRLLHPTTTTTPRGLAHHLPTQPVLVSSSPNPSLKCSLTASRLPKLRCCHLPSPFLFWCLHLPAESVSPLSVFTAMFVGGGCSLCSVLPIIGSICARQTAPRSTCAVSASSTKHQVQPLRYATAEPANLKTLGFLEAQGAPCRMHFTVPDLGLVQSWLTSEAWHGSCIVRPCMHASASTGGPRLPSKIASRSSPSSATPGSCHIPVTVKLTSLIG
jgi:hypothetical protein